MSENMVLRRLFSPKREGLTGGWRKLHNEKLHNLYSSPNIIRIMWEGCVERFREVRNAYKFFVGKPKGKRPRGRPRRK
jgi:hypothetical protein